MGRYLSRTYWMAWGIILLATWLCFSDKIIGSGWITIVGGVMAMWQARRYADNKLEGGAP